MTYYQNEIQKFFGCSEVAAKNIHQLVCVSGISFSNSSQEQLNRAYTNARDALVYLNKLED